MYSAHANINVVDDEWMAAIIVFVLFGGPNLLVFGRIYCIEVRGSALIFETHNKNNQSNVTREV